ncbi:Spo0E family sporulation regulatory protein-aspartic acid phosphatase [Thermanaerosceptrum fracticalcis]|uniref:Spo0E family sporulation regulatory protein-aspartic acid phosphatase n=1 Tax=Thermanaerosceptrum fracticalcis TaxID=1712410 RepID=A0A7G6E3N7_THEFR|nr:Spo0E family sporulation regulatory protein-aspartic acid phosphatase [Thermanaerosceptrum fracticalcis]
MKNIITNKFNYRRLLKRMIEYQRRKLVTSIQQKWSNVSNKRILSISERLDRLIVKYLKWIRKI